MSHKPSAHYLWVLLFATLLLAGCCEDEEPPIVPACEISVDLPNSAVTWKVGQTYTIQWTSSGPCGSNLSIDLYQSGEHCEDVADTVAEAGTFVWTCETCGGDSTGYVVRVTDQESGAYDESDLPFTISEVHGATLEFTEPYGALRTQGEDLELIWEASDLTGQAVVIELLCNGAVCDTLAAEAENDGSYTWTVEPVGTEECGYAFRITDQTSGAIQTTSVTFCIRAPGDLLVTVPNGGETWLAGEEYEITWVASEDPADWVTIDLLRTGTLCATIADSTEDNGRFTWTAAQCGPVWDNYTVRITNLTTGETDTSDDPFGIYATALSITAPTAGDIWVEGTGHDIVWEHQGSPGDLVAIALHVQDALCQVIAESAPNTGTFAWTATPCEEVVPADDEGPYTIRVTDLTYGAFATSDAFDIPAPILTVTSPEAGLACNEGEECEITWAQEGPDPGLSVCITLLLDGAVCDTIAADTTNTGSYTWLATKCGETTCGYQVQVTDLTVGSSGTSAADFCIFSPGIAVTVPNGGETWIEGANYELTWMKVGATGNSVSIDLLRDGTVCETISAGAANAGSYTWTAALCGTDSTGYAIMVTDLSTEASDTSDAEFTIRPFVFAVTSPTGGEEWIDGTFHSITWSRTEGVSGDSVMIELLWGDGRATIDESVLNNRAHTWLVAQQDGQVDGYRIVITDNNTTHDVATSEGTFSIPGPVITITSPGTSEAWIEGTEHDIAWSIEGTAGAMVKLELLSGGTSCATIADSTDNDGLHSWAVADCPADGVGLSIRIQDLTTLAEAVSDSFDIMPPVLTVTAPNGGETWDEGTAHAITWNVVGTMGETVILQLLQNGTVCDTIEAEAVASEGTYTWTAQKCGNVAAGFTVRVSDPTTGAADVSDAPFSIPPDNALTVTSPDGGEEWQAGSAQTITWSTTGLAGAEVTIELLRADELVATIADSALNDGSFDWTPFQDEGFATGYQVRITDEAMGLSDTSNETFSITAPALVVTAPNGGETWYEGLSYAITWTSEAAAEDSVRIELYRGGVLLETIAAETDNDGTHSWTPRQYDLNQWGYVIRVTDLTLGISDWSDAAFGIPGILTVTSPAGGEVWYVGESHTLTWTQSASAGDNVMFELLHEGVACSTLTASTANDLSEDWTVAQCGTDTTGYAVRITDLSNGAVGVSDSTFTIFPATIAITAPNGGERWPEGTSQVIRWTRSGVPGSVVLVELLQNGAPVETISGEAANVDSLAWTVTQSGTDSSGYAIRITDLTCEETTDTSDATFIIPTVITVTSPNAGGDALTEGTNHNLQWDYSTSTGDSVIIRLLQNDEVCTIIDTTDNDGGLLWAVEGCSTDTTGYRLQIYDPTSGALDVSDSTFSIAPTITVTYPNGGESLTEGNDYQIEWTCSDSTHVGGSVLIERLLDGAVIDTVATSAGNDGGQSWGNVQRWGGTQPGYKIRITGNASGVSDESDAPFSIVP